MKIIPRCLCICVVIFIPLIESAKILVAIPTPSLSHQLVFRSYTRELARRGHEVTVITPDPVFPKGEAPPNLREIDVHDVTYQVRNVLFDAPSGQNEALYNQIDIIWNLFAYVFYEQLKSNEVSKLIKNKNQKFDLLILESIVRPAISLRHVYKVPVILFSSLGVLDETNILFGAVRHPLLYPTFYRERVYNLTLFEKIEQLYKHYIFEDLIRNKKETENRLMRDYFGPDIPTISELQNHVDLLFVNTHPIWNDNRPVPPNVVYLGGLHMPVQRELPKDLKSFLDSSKHGVIYMSFGTNVKPSLLPSEKIQMVNKVFSQLPYDILWKYDLDELPGKSKNVKLVKWVPQSDLLRHTKIKLFITQGGLQSTDEAIVAGVPLIGMPMIADQWFNVEKYVRHGIGMKMEFKTLAEEQLLNGINETINNESYRRNALRLKKIYNDQPQTSLERAIWWTEYVLRHGGAKHLRAASANISWKDYLELELVSFKDASGN
ncbi:hypothetical protein K1T71_012525 [Dendrolimus kikuchii]|uniref:Uncharacterized protein n=1 Tax=Dendrolimus kikuchii TaxID=765133 RepID=A0ACC1CJU0_9NEOP|nr:hypothetical protein K1T71_012525 [Dendrolimus kikuchii]